MQVKVSCMCNRTLNSAMYIQNMIQPILLLFMQQEGEVQFHQNNACLYDTYVTQQALQDVQQLHWMA